MHNRMLLALLLFGALAPLPAHASVNIMPLFTLGRYEGGNFGCGMLAANAPVSAANKGGWGFQLGYASESFQFGVIGSRTVLSSSCNGVEGELGLARIGL